MEGAHNTGCPTTIVQKTIQTLHQQVMAIRSPTRRPYVKTKISETEVLLLYDTGSDITCINAKSLLYVDPKAQVNKLQSIRNFQSAGGQALKVIGTTNLSCKIDNKTVEHKFFVIENLNEKGILGMDFIARHELNQDPKTNTFFWSNENRQHTWRHGKLFCKKDTKLTALSVTSVKVEVQTDEGAVPAQGCQMIGQISSPEQPLVTGQPCLLENGPNNTCTILIQNCAPFSTLLKSHELVGYVENVQQEEKYVLDDKFINSMTVTREMKIISEKERNFLKENSVLKVPEQYRKEYEKLLEQCHEVFSRTKTDLGKSDLVMHDISLKTNDPVYVKQFKIPDAHMKEVTNHLTEWLKLGVVEPCRSKYNSPIFVVPKKDGSLRVVQDFRALNNQTHVDKYSMHDVTECVNQIGRAGSTIFTTIDLTSGFWQMMLDPNSQQFTAFTIPGYGQMKWKVAPMGLLGSPASFQRLVEKALEGISNVIVYIDDLIIHTNSHEQHMKVLHKVFMRLFKHNLKINLKKCVFGSPEVSYLGFRLTPEGIKPGIDKLKAVAQCKPPCTVKEVRQFLGLCNFFRSHVKNFAIVSAPMAQLTRKDIKWRKGEMPPEALKSFRELQSILCSEPVMDYPRRDRSYCLITDASAGDEKHPGGLGAILTQLDENKQHKVIAYASRKLATHEKNYTPFLLEMQASIWGMEHFFTYLKGRHFTLFTDHKPLEKLGLVHTKTLNRLQEMMNSYDFTIQYKKGSEMPADFLSRNIVSSITWDDLHLTQEQDNDKLIKAIKEFLLNRKLPENKVMWSSIKGLAADCFVEDEVVWKRIKRQGEPSRVVLFVPKTMTSQILKDAHGHLLAGHDGLFKTKERIMQCYYWPCMDKDINDHIQQCQKCQMRKKNLTTYQTELKPLPQCTEPNQRVHADLFGPLKTSGNNKKYILCMTDAFSKYVELVPLPDKEAITVASGIFSRWICRFGSPLQIVTDGGKEFTANLSNELFNQMQIIHLTTSPYHPQCNSQAEVVNKTIAKYLSSFVDKTTLDWELYLAPMMFAYNTAVHKSTKNTPYFLTFGIEPRTPNFPATELRKKFYGEQDVDEFQHRLTLARKLAVEENEDARNSYEQQYNKNVKIANFHVGQQVLLNEFNTLHKNKKLSPKFSGPHVITKLIHNTNVELKLQNGRLTIVHVNRIKPFLYDTPSDPDNSDSEFDPSDFEEDEPQKLQIKKNKTISKKKTPQNHHNLEEDEDDSQYVNPLDIFRSKNIFDELTSNNQNSRNGNSTAQPEKRKRGRPPKLKFSNNGGDIGVRNEDETLTFQNKQLIDPPQIERRITRSMIAQNGSVEKITSVEIVEQIFNVKNKNNNKNKHKNKNVQNKSLWSALQKRNFKETGDIFGTQLQCDPDIMLPELNQPEDDSDSSISEPEEFELADESSESGDEIYQQPQPDQPQQAHNEEELPHVPQPQPETPAGNMLPLPPAQLPPVLRTRRRLQGNLPNTPIKRRAHSDEREPKKATRPRSKSNSSKVLEYSTSEDEEKNEPKPPIPKLPSTRGVPTRSLPGPSTMVPPPTIQPRRVTTETSHTHGKNDRERTTSKTATKDSLAKTTRTEPGTVPRHEIPKTREPRDTKDQAQGASNVSQTTGETLQPTGAMGQEPFTRHGLIRTLMEYISLRDTKATREEQTAALSQAYKYLHRSPEPIEPDERGKIEGIKLDGNLLNVVQRVNARRANDPAQTARPLRSNTKAPDIPPTESVSLEHQLKKLEQKFNIKKK